MQQAKIRLAALDVLRGLIMVLMALDHARAFITRDHPFEIWSAPLLAYDSAAPFLTRFVTHLCAPGFFFLMGGSLALLSAKRAAAGWPQRRVVRFLVIRGLVLLAVQQVIENPAWMIGLMGAAPDAIAAGDGFVLPVGVLYALGTSMIVWAFLLQLPSLAILSISVAAVLLTQALVPQAPVSDPSSLPLALLLIPGKSGPLFVVYPTLAWLGLAGFGIVWAREREMWRLGPARTLALGLAMLAIFVVIRSNGGFGNVHVPVQAGWIGFLNVTKYPPSLAFVTLTLGIDLLLLATLLALSRVPSRWFALLQVYGRAPLFFYIAHLYLFAIIGLGFPRGASLPVLYPLWVLGLALLYFPTAWYARFKERQPEDSLWRLF